MEEKHVQLIISSVRPSRIGDQIAQWIIEVASKVPGLTFELIDLKDWRLPMDDEPEQPKKGGLDGYLEPHTKAWSRKIGEGDGYIFLLPQYNWGYPAALKNALDHLFFEWENKPAIIVTYGARGGVKAAAQLREVLTGLHMRPVDTMPALPLRQAEYDARGRLVDPAVAFSEQEGDIVKALRMLGPELRGVAGG